MSRVYLNEGDLPFCKGCGHTTISENMDLALQQLSIPVHDVILVTDIGCHGIIDKSFRTHTVHGLHGRSVALASGITMGLNNPDKKVIVFIGDGGATIGMQHLIDAAHHNFNMTVVVHNNMLYGMTGGQPSDLTPLGFRTPSLPDGAQTKGMDICNIAAAAGASYVKRIIGIGNISGHLAEAVSRKGFSLIEVMEICPSYAVKSNPGMKLREVAKNTGLDEKIYAEREQEFFHGSEKKELRSLIDAIPVIPVEFPAVLSKPVRIMISGSAGEGVQQAAELFARAAISAGLSVTKKGSYPVTVGIGFSSADIIISSEPVLFTGTSNPDYIIVTSPDGLDYSRSAISQLRQGKIFADTGLSGIMPGSNVITNDFRANAGNRNAALYSLLYLCVKEKLFPVEALLKILGDSKLAGKADWSQLSASII